MAGFVENVGRPESVTGTVPVHESIASEIGAAVSGAAKLLDVGLKASAKDREDKINAQLEDRLSEELKNWGPNKQQPTFIGDNPDPAQAAMGSAPSIQRGTEQLNNLASGSKQGRIGSAELMGRASVIVQGMIHDHPRFADAIRERAQKILGVNPSAEMVKLNTEDDRAQAEAARAVQMQYAKGWIDNGNQPITNSDGTLDWDRMAAGGAMVIHAKSQMKIELDQLDIDYKRGEIDKQKNPPMPEWMYNQKQQGIIEDKVGPLFKLNLNRMFDMASRLDTDMHNLSSAQQAEFRLNVMNNLGQMKTSMELQVDNLISSLPVEQRSPANVKAVKEYFTDQLKPFEEMAKGDLSVYENYIRTTKLMGDMTKIDFRQYAPGIAMGMDLFGPNFAEPMAALFFQKGTPLGDQAQQELWQGLQHVMGIAQGQPNKGLVTPADGKAAAAIIQMWNAHPESLEHVDPATYQRMMAVAAQTGREQQGDPKAIQAATNLMSGAGAMAAFDHWAARPENKGQVQETANEFLNLNQTNINSQGAALQPTVLKNQMTIGPKGQMEHHTITYDSEYNPSLGKVVMTIRDETGKDLSGNPQLLQSAPAQTISQIKGINQSLGVMEHMKDYGGDKAKSMPVDQFKFLSVQSAGIKVREGMMPPSVKAPKKEETPAASSTTGSSNDGWSITVQ